MDFHALNRKELQRLCKKHGIPANKTNAAMADALTSLGVSMPRKALQELCKKNNIPANLSTAAMAKALGSLQFAVGHGDNHHLAKGKKSNRREQRKRKAPKSKCAVEKTLTELQPRPPDQVTAWLPRRSRRLAKHDPVPSGVQQLVVKEEGEAVNPPCNNAATAEHRVCRKRKASTSLLREIGTNVINDINKDENCIKSEQFVYNRYVDDEELQRKNKRRKVEVSTIMQCTDPANNLVVYSGQTHTHLISQNAKKEEVSSNRRSRKRKVTTGLPPLHKHAANLRKSMVKTVSRDYTCEAHGKEQGTFTESEEKTAPSEVEFSIDCTFNLRLEDDGTCIHFQAKRNASTLGASEEPPRMVEQDVEKDSIIEFKSSSILGASEEAPCMVEQDAEKDSKMESKNTSIIGASEEVPHMVEQNVEKDSIMEFTSNTDVLTSDLNNSMSSSHYGNIEDGMNIPCKKLNVLCHGDSYNASSPLPSKDNVEGCSGEVEAKVSSTDPKVMRESFDLIERTEGKLDSINQSEQSEEGELCCSIVNGMHEEPCTVTSNASDLEIVGTHMEQSLCCSVYPINEIGNPDCGHELNTSFGTESYQALSFQKIGEDSFFICSGDLRDKKDTPEESQETEIKQAHSKYEELGHELEKAFDLEVVGIDNALERKEGHAEQCDETDDMGKPDVRLDAGLPPLLSYKYEATTREMGEVSMQEFAEQSEATEENDCPSPSCTVETTVGKTNLDPSQDMRLTEYRARNEMENFLYMSCLSEATEGEPNLADRKELGEQSEVHKKRFLEENGKAFANEKVSLARDSTNNEDCSFSRGTKVTLTEMADEEFPWGLENASLSDAVGSCPIGNKEHACSEQNVDTVLSTSISCTDNVILSGVDPALKDEITKPDEESSQVLQDELQEDDIAGQSEDDCILEHTQATYKDDRIGDGNQEFSKQDEHIPQVQGKLEVIVEQGGGYEANGPSCFLPVDSMKDEDYISEHVEMTYQEDKTGDVIQGQEELVDPTFEAYGEVSIAANNKAQHNEEIPAFTKATISDTEEQREGNDANGPSCFLPVDSMNDEDYISKHVEMTYPKDKTGDVIQGQEELVDQTFEAYGEVSISGNDKAQSNEEIPASTKAESSTINDIDKSARKRQDVDCLANENVHIPVSPESNAQNGAVPIRLLTNGPSCFLPDDSMNDEDYQEDKTGDAIQGQEELVGQTFNAYGEVSIADKEQNNEEIPASTKVESSTISDIDKSVQKRQDVNCLANENAPLLVSTASNAQNEAVPIRLLTTSANCNALNSIPEERTENPALEQELRNGDYWRPLCVEDETGKDDKFVQSSISETNFKDGEKEIVDSPSKASTGLTAYVLSREESAAWDDLVSSSESGLMAINSPGHKFCEARAHPEEINIECSGTEVSHEFHDDETTLSNEDGQIQYLAHEQVFCDAGVYWRKGTAAGCDLEEITPGTVLESSCEQCAKTRDKSIAAQKKYTMETSLFMKSNGDQSYTWDQDIANKNNTESPLCERGSRDQNYNWDQRVASTNTTERVATNEADAYLEYFFAALGELSAVFLNPTTEIDERNNEPNVNDDVLKAERPSLPTDLQATKEEGHPLAAKQQQSQHIDVIEQVRSEESGSQVAEEHQFEKDILSNKKEAHSEKEEEVISLCLLFMAMKISSAEVAAGTSCNKTCPDSRPECTDITYNVACGMVKKIEDGQDENACRLKTPTKTHFSFGEDSLLFPMRGIHSSDKAQRTVKLMEPRSDRKWKKMHTPTSVRVNKDFSIKKCRTPAKGSSVQGSLVNNKENSNRKTIPEGRSHRERSATKSQLSGKVKPRELCEQLGKKFVPLQPLNQ